ncbi:oligosaccharide flippase family protein [Chloroflexota bacterium]
MKELLFRTFNFIYTKLFQEKASLDIKVFINNVLNIALGTGFMALFNLVSQLIIGRVLGPEDYGKFTLIISIGLLFASPLHFIGIAMVKYNSEENETTRQSSIISTSFVLLLSFGIVLLVIYLFLSSVIKSAFSIDSDIFNLSIYLFAFYILFSFACAILQGLFRMKKLAFSQFVFGLISLVFLLAGFFILNTQNYEVAIYSIILGYIVITAVIFINNYRFLLCGIHKLWTIRLLRYGVYAFLGGLFVAINQNVSKLIINNYMELSDVGIYNAYFITSVNVATLVGGIITIVLFPTASRYKNKRAIFDRIIKITPLLFLLGLPLLVGLQFILLIFYGDKYTFTFGSSLLFALCGILVVLYTILGPLMSSVGRKGVKVVAIAQGFLTGLVLSSTIILVPLMGITGAILGLTMSYGIFCLIIIFMRRYFNRSDDEYIASI